MRHTFYSNIGHVFFHSFVRKTTVNKNGYNFRYTHPFILLTGD
jgi:hypothetical protein